jgi:protocatechuate 3,4-dioxygenase beta subunit
MTHLAPSLDTFTAALPHTTHAARQSPPSHDDHHARAHHDDLPLAAHSAHGLHDPRAHHVRCHADDLHDDHREGLHEDLRELASRRDALRLFGGVGAATLLGSLGATAAALANTPTAAVPTETAGPYPGDGSNGPNVLDDSGIVRRDIRRSFGSSTTRATGIPLRVNLTVTDASNDFSPLTGAAVYLWHCDREGRYSIYSSGVEDENYLRGIQPTDDDGTATFTTIFPGCYAGRWPHIHFEVYSSVSKATASGPIVKTSQIALPKATCSKVYARSSYASSRRNLAGSALTSDNVFRDDRAIHQLATVTGNAAKGFVANLTIGV